MINPKKNLHGNLSSFANENTKMILAKNFIKCTHTENQYSKWEPIENLRFIRNVLYSVLYTIDDSSTFSWQRKNDTNFFLKCPMVFQNGYVIIKKSEELENALRI